MIKQDFIDCELRPDYIRAWGCRWCFDYGDNANSFRMFTYLPENKTRFKITEKGVEDAEET